MSADTPPDCLNCGHALGTPRPNFCPACGQETSVRPPRFGEFIQQFGGAYFATEGALWRTLKLLLFRPGELTRQYLAGRRKHYVLPLRLYLSVSLVVLLLIRLAGAIDIDAVDNHHASAALPPKPQNMALEIGLGRAGLKDGVFYCSGFPQWLCRRMQARIDVEPRQMAEQMSRVGDRIANHWGVAMFVLMPAFALMLKLLYWPRRLHYTEHLVFALHLHSFWFFIFALMLFNVDAISLLGSLAIPVYGVLAMRRVYGGRWWPLLARALLLSGFYLVLIVLALGAVALIALLL